MLNRIKLESHVYFKRKSRTLNSVQELELGLKFEDFN